ncbi:MAG TPA: iron ABC transporter permease [Bacillales bacterium]|nr:iron ABC transporter permease [Bacillales bacterium]
MNTLSFQKQRILWVTVILSALILLSFFISLNLGSIGISPIDVIKTLFGQGSAKQELVLFQFRLPRIVLAVLVGAGLAISGGILQGVARNDLADPGIIGINMGAGLAVVVFMYFFREAVQGSLAVFLIPFSAFAGAGVSAVLIYLFAWKKGVTPARLILVGIGINAAFGAILLIFQMNLAEQGFNQSLIWLSGSLWGTSWPFVLATLPWIVILLPITMYKARHLDVLNLGDSIATGFGVHVEKERRLLLILAVALAGACVAVAGGIAFLGLVAPHLARRLVGPRHRIFMPVSALIGTLLLLVSDMIGKNILSPTEIPVGLVVSIIGAPYFLYLLVKND